MNRVLFYDEDGEDISALISTGGGKAGPLWNSGTIVYDHAILGGIRIGSYGPGGHIVLKPGYTSREVCIDD